MRRLALACVVATALAAAFVPSAGAAGGPPTYLTANGIAMPGGRGILETIHPKNGHPNGRTIVLRIDRQTDRVADSELIRGDFGIAAIGLSAPKPTGLSADGTTLVLSPIGIQRKRTTFAIVDTRGLRLRRVVTFRGTFGIDGVSPDGSSAYFIQYLNANGTRYAVRRYDIAAARLDPNPIVDPTEEEQMRGFPITRVTSPNGRWAYTLYSGAIAGKPPFIHALDMAGKGAAKCIDLPRSLAHGSFHDRLQIAPDGRTLTVSNRRKGTVATVDTRTFDVSASPPSTDRPVRREEGAGFPWLLLSLGLGLLLVVGLAWGTPRLHRRLAG